MFSKSFLPENLGFDGNAYQFPDFQRVFSQILGKSGLVERFLVLQCLPDRPIDPTVRPNIVVIQVSEGRIQPINPAVGLVPVFVRVRQRVEHDRVCGDTVPSFSTRRILDQVYPPLRIRNRFVFVAVPLRNLGTLRPTREL